MQTPSNVIWVGFPVHKAPVIPLAEGAGISAAQEFFEVMDDLSEVQINPSAATASEGVPQPVPSQPESGKAPAPTDEEGFSFANDETIFPEGGLVLLPLLTLQQIAAGSKGLMPSLSQVQDPDGAARVTRFDVGPERVKSVVEDAPEPDFGEHMPAPAYDPATDLPSLEPLKNRDVSDSSLKSAIAGSQIPRPERLGAAAPIAAPISATTAWTVQRPVAEHPLQIAATAPEAAAQRAEVFNKTAVLSEPLPADQVDETSVRLSRSEPRAGAATLPKNSDQKPRTLDQGNPLVTGKNPTKAGSNDAKAPPLADAPALRERPEKTGVVTTVLDHPARFPTTEMAVRPRSPQRVEEAPLVPLATAKAFHPEQTAPKPQEAERGAIQTAGLPLFIQSTDQPAAEPSSLAKLPGPEGRPLPFAEQSELSAPILAPAHAGVDEAPFPDSPELIRPAKPDQQGQKTVLPIAQHGLLLQSSPSDLARSGTAEAARPPAPVAPDPPAPAPSRAVTAQPERAESSTSSLIWLSKPHPAVPQAIGQIASAAPKPERSVTAMPERPMSRAFIAEDPRFAVKDQGAEPAAALAEYTDVPEPAADPLPSEAKMLAQALPLKEAWAAPHLIHSQTSFAAHAGAVPSADAQRLHQHVAQAILQGFRSGQTRTLELKLMPEELGHLRFDIATQGERLHITLFVERPDVLDLMRRQIDVLAQELRQSGLGQATLDFGHWSQESAQKGPPKDQMRPWLWPSIAAQDDTGSAQTDLTRGQGRVDIRL